MDAEILAHFTIERRARLFISKSLAFRNVIRGITTTAVPNGARFVPSHVLQDDRFQSRGRRLRVLYYHEFAASQW